MFWTEFCVCRLAGIGAGLGTGCAGMSAAVVITPLLVTFLHVPAYTAVGIALCSDVFASLVSAYTYKKNGNLDIKNGLTMMATVIVFTAFGSYVSSHIAHSTLESFSIIITLVMGIKFIIAPIVKTPGQMKQMTPIERTIKSILCGCAIGFVCGFAGAGGGIMMLMALTLILGYELKTAVGTSVFIMSFTALTGGMSHFLMGDWPDPLILTFCVVFTFGFAQLGAIIANKVKPVTLNRITGIILVVLVIVLTLVEYIRL